MAKSRTARRKKKLSKGKIIFLVVLVLVVIAALVALWYFRPDVIQGVIASIGAGKEEADTDKGGDTTEGGEKPGGDENPGKPDNPYVEGDTLEMTVLDIGQGDCIYIAFPDGTNMMMDIGSEFGSTSPWNHADEFLKEKNVTTIDYLFITHGDYDHIRDAKKLIDNYEIKSFYMPLDKAQDSSTWLKLLDAARAETYTDENGNTVDSAYNNNVGEFTISGENWEMKCYSFDEADYPEGTNAEKINAVSPICLLEYAERTIVLTGDANEMTEEYVLAKGYLDGIDTDVLKVGHHGSKSSTTQAFLDEIDAEFAIISTSGTREEPNEKYTHPNPDLLKRLDSYVDAVPDADYNGFREIYITASDGDITVTIGENGGINITASEAPDKNYGEVQVAAVIMQNGEVYAVCIKRGAYVVQE